MKKFIFLVIGIVLLVGVFSLFNQPDETKPIDEVVPDVVENLSYETSKAVVKIVHHLSDGTQNVIKTASAVILKEDDLHYYAITNYHVLIKDTFETVKIDVVDFLGNQYDASIVLLNQAQEIISQSYDLGLIKFSKNQMDYLIPEFRQSSLNSSILLTAIGYPDGVRTVTHGYYQSHVNVSNYPIQLLSHSVPLASGNSGGGLFDPYGRLVGINAAATYDESNQQIQAYAIPADKVLEFLSLFNL